jgi:hypothetical protein
MGSGVGYDGLDVFGVSCVGFHNICDIDDDSGENEGRKMKRLLELFKKIRKPMPKPSVTHRDKTKYTRKNKFKPSENNV